MNKYDVLKYTITLTTSLVGYMFGKFDGLMYSLLTLMVLDYATGILCAILEKRLSSEVGFKGILKKVLMLVVVSISYTIDLHLLSDSGVLRSSVIGFYLVNECISILENIFKVGVPLPKKLKDVLKQLKSKGDK